MTPYSQWRVQTQDDVCMSMQVNLSIICTSMSLGASSLAGPRAKICWSRWSGSQDLLWQFAALDYCSEHMLGSGVDAYTQC